MSKGVASMITIIKGANTSVVHLKQREDRTPANEWRLAKSPPSFLNGTGARLVAFVGRPGYFIGILVTLWLWGCYVPPNADMTVSPVGLQPEVRLETVPAQPEPTPTSISPAFISSRHNSVMLSGEIAPVDQGFPFRIGTSVEGRPLLTYRFGTGPIFVALIGGIHGGYEPNTVTLAGRFIQQLSAMPEIIPPEISLFVIPAMNPDGYVHEGLKGRTNANQVDLNRNWGCEWKNVTSSYYGQPYNTGTSAFSEPETRAVRDFILQNAFKVAVFYHSRGAVVFYGACGGAGQSLELAKIVSRETGYDLEDSPIHPSDAERLKKLPGEAVNYFDVQGLAAIDIELTTRQPDDIDWERNYRGLLAILDYSVQEFGIQQALNIAVPAY